MSPPAARGIGRAVAKNFCLAGTAPRPVARPAVPTILPAPAGCRDGAWGRERAGPMAAAAATAMRILVVEDDDDTRNAVAAVLIREGHQVDQAATLGAALV